MAKDIFSDPEAYDRMLAECRGLREADEAAERYRREEADQRFLAAKDDFVELAREVASFVGCMEAADWKDASGRLIRLAVKALGRIETEESDD